MRRWVIALACAGLGACASSGGSYVDPPAVAALGDTQPLIATIVDVVESEASASRVLVLDRPHADQVSDTLTPDLVAALEAARFSFAPADAPRLTYQVTPLEQGTLLRIVIGRLRVAAYFRGAGMAGPLVVRRDS